MNPDRSIKNFMQINNRNIPNTSDHFIYTKNKKQITFVAFRDCVMRKRMYIYIYIYIYRFISKSHTPAINKYIPPML